MKSDCEIVVVDDESSSCNKEFYSFDNDKVKYYKEDIVDESIKNLYKGVDVVFHLAARSRIQPSIDEPFDTFLNNTLGTLNVLQCCKLNNIKRIVYSASSSFYGKKNKGLLNENFLCDCLNPYSLSKYQGEQVCELYSKLWNLSAIVLRYFNVYGPREPIRGIYAPVIGLFKRQRDNGEKLTIIGDGEQRRDFTYVKDVVQANILASQAKNIKYDVFNVGNGKNYSINEIARMIGSEVIYLPERLGEARETLADNAKIKRVLNWNPEFKLKDVINSY